jgi:beta-glucosidase
MDPLFFGKYPETMRLMVGPRLPEFTDEQAENLRQSLDFVGLNVVTASYVTNDTQLQDTYDGYFEDMRIKITGRYLKIDYQKIFMQV